MLNVKLGKTSNEYKLGNISVSIGKQPTPFGKLVLVMIGINAHIFTRQDLEINLKELILEQVDIHSLEDFRDLIKLYQLLFPHYLNPLNYQVDGL